jgi:predicted MFS family arabinose efflux permease
VLAAVWAARVLPGRAAGDDGEQAAYGWKAVLCPQARPLLTGGLLVGLGSSAFWTFAVEHLTDAGALSSAASRSFLGVVGLASILATLTGDLLRRLGAARAYVLTTFAEAAGLALLALAPSSLAAALASAVLFGAAYNGAVAVQVIWSAHVFPARPSLGLSAAMLANALGLMLGPLGAGLLAGPLGLETVLLLGAGVVAAAGLFAPREVILAQPNRADGRVSSAV